MDLATSDVLVAEIYAFF